MKKIIPLLIVLFQVGANAQTINSVTIVPPNPTTSDNIMIVSECMFPSGSCDQHTQGFNVAGSSISAWAFHCLGMLTVICTDTDTFSIGMLPPGTYNVDFHLESGYGTVPCTPGIVPGPNAYTTFSVSTATGVNETENNNSVFIYPNPASNQLAVYNKQFAIESIEIIDMIGHSIIRQEPKSIGKQLLLDVAVLTRGIYFVRIRGENQERVLKMFKN